MVDEVVGEESRLSPHTTSALSSPTKGHSDRTAWDFFTFRAKAIQVGRPHWPQFVPGSFLYIVITVLLYQGNPDATMIEIMDPGADRPARKLIWIPALNLLDSY